jgi:hypothetical protein
MMVQYHNFECVEAVFLFFINYRFLAISKFNKIQGN